MSNENTVVVWDIFIRIFHWSLVIAFTVAYFTSEEENAWHIYAGYTVLGLIIFRILWGLIGSQHARFSDFVCSPGGVYNYIRELRAGSAKHYLGHNPLGGWMVVALLVTLLVVTISGLKVYAIEEGRGPLAGNPAVLTLISAAHAEDDEKEETESQDEEFWEEIHEGSTNFMLFLISLHLIGVILSSKLHKENLVKAMLTGKKPKP
ncbi:MULTISPECIES: cytochrome b/b6 domain-containing protein [Methylomonas]|uniref:Cytochrome B n=2 Tax=Methylomonas TaxID=416 RepID=A0A140E6K8_9GAMM|nr:MULTISPECIES: cytochrome b/b6 domain-containing protein [Methylomonas]AMK79032.1 cytochrome B [Methylomonas denitrificans]OAI00195.1 cytochrome B [Methylomonas methanica]TCV79175.1 cytochrome b [Methylomonas methanica]